MADSPEFNPEHIDAKREEIRRTLAAEGISAEDLVEMDPDDALDSIGVALLKHQPTWRPEDDSSQ